MQVRKLLQCNILKGHNFLVHIKDVHKHVPRLHSTSFTTYYENQEAYRDAASVHIYTCRVVEYCASEDVTPELNHVIGFEIA